MSNPDILLVARALANRYPADLQPVQLADLPRIVFHVQLVLDRHGTRAAVCDLGGGIGLFTPVCARAGLRAVLVDDFLDGVNAHHDASALPIHRECGVGIVATDALAPALDFPVESFDAVTAFETIEHWHGSPRVLLRKAVSWLKAGGHLIISMPNCVDLKRRIMVPLGRGAWSSFEDWYAEPAFRGHVREPDTDDLRRIASDLGLTDVQILGRNWSLYGAPAPLAWMTLALDKLLRVRPSFCSTLYLIGRKPVPAA